MYIYVYMYVCVCELVKNFLNSIRKQGIKPEDLIDKETKEKTDDLLLYRHFVVL